MSDTISSLDVDTLVQKHIRLSPAFKFYQLCCLAFALLPSVLLSMGAAGIAFDLISYIIDYVQKLIFSSTVSSPVLDFHGTRTLFSGTLYGDKYSWLTDRFELALALIAMPLYLYIAVSFASLQLNVFVRAAILLLWTANMRWL